MGIPPADIPLLTLLSAWLGWLALLGVAARHAPWSRVAGPRQHLFLGMVTVLAGLWSFEAVLAPGLGYHFFGLTLCTLMLGWALALLAGALALTVLSLLAGALPGAALDGLILVAVPVLVSQGIRVLVQRTLPPHLFTYLFLCAFGAAIVSVSVAILLLSWMVVASGVHPASRVSGEYLPFLPLFVLPEGILNGMLATAFVALKPDWMSTYDPRCERR